MNENKQRVIADCVTNLIKASGVDVDNLRPEDVVRIFLKYSLVMEKLYDQGYAAGFSDGYEEAEMTIKNPE